VLFLVLPISRTCVVLTWLQFHVLTVQLLRSAVDPPERARPSCFTRGAGTVCGAPPCHVNDHQQPSNEARIGAPGSPPGECLRKYLVTCSMKLASSMGDKTLPTSLGGLSRNQRASSPEYRFTRRWNSRKPGRFPSFPRGQPPM
jgi:hypothetical protein